MKKLGSSNGVDEGVLVDDELSTVCSSNEEGFARILRLYARPGDVIVDPTHGHGRFWATVDKTPYTVHLTDLTMGIDARALPHPDGTVDVEVLDPPYRYTPQKNRPQDDVHGHGKAD